MATSTATPMASPSGWFVGVWVCREGGVASRQRTGRPASGLRAGGQLCAWCVVPPLHPRTHTLSLTPTHLTPHTQADTRGVFASVFCDFGPAFQVLDVDGERGRSVGGVGARQAGVGWDWVWQGVRGCCGSGTASTGMVAAPTHHSGLEPHTRQPPLLPPAPTHAHSPRYLRCPPIPPSHSPPSIPAFQPTPPPLTQCLPTSPLCFTGEEPHTGIVAGITPGCPTLVTTVEDERLEFQDGERGERGERGGQCISWGRRE